MRQHDRHETSLTERALRSSTSFTAGHHINKCKHGVVMGQCRCPSPNKTVNIVHCVHTDLPAPSGEVYKTSNEWFALHPEIKLIDPDGWRKNDGVTFDTLITEKEFIIRVGMSTVQLIREPAF